VKVEEIEIFSQKFSSGRSSWEEGASGGGKKIPAHTEKKGANTPKNPPERLTGKRKRGSTLA